MEGVVEEVLGALHQRALEGLAAVGVNAGNGDLQAVQGGGHLNINFARILVGGEVRLDVHRLRLVDDAAVQGAAVHEDGGDLAVTWRVGENGVNGVQEF